MQHVIVGAGPVGAATAVELAERGHEVRLVSRRGRGPEHPGVERVAADAADGAALAGQLRGAAVLYNCANPSGYDRWAVEWPPLAAALLTGAERAGCRLVVMGNLYAYGPVDGPLTPDLPLRATGTKGRMRAAMWRDALEAQRQGRVEVTEARASDFIGPGPTDQAHLGERVVPRVLAGRTVRVLGAPDQPHSFSYLPDVARTLATLGTDERAFGRAWHVPSPPALTQAATVAALAAAAGRPAPKVVGLPRWALRTAGLVSAQVRELDEVRYQFERPFVLDATDTERTFGLRATAMDEVARATVEWWRAWEDRAA
jgi:nucleoside-diphosphate-sugar epimerase